MVGNLVEVIAVDFGDTCLVVHEKVSEAAEKEVPEKKKTIKASTVKEEKGTLETILENPMARQVGRTAASIITRSLLGVLGLGGTTRKRKSTSWF